MSTIAFAGLSMQEMLIILLIVLVLFGASKIPQMMKGFGQGIKEFKKGMREEEEPKAGAVPDSRSNPPPGAGAAPSA